MPILQNLALKMSSGAITVIEAGLPTHVQKTKARTSSRGVTKIHQGELSFCNETNSQMDEGGEVDVVFLEFSKVFDSIPQKIFVEKLLKYGC